MAVVVVEHRGNLLEPLALAVLVEVAMVQAQTLALVLAEPRILAVAEVVAHGLGQVTAQAALVL